MSRTNYVPLKIVCGADVFAGTPFLSFTEYLPSVVRLALAALLTTAALANIGNSACAQRMLWKRRRNGQAKHNSVEQPQRIAMLCLLLGSQRSGKAQFG